MKNTLLTALSMLFFFATHAQNKKSYLYLEVNKNLPVKVLLNDKTVKNSNKGYIIIPNLPTGSNKLEFDFANPNFKNHVFEITTQSKSLGLKLSRVANNEFILQDVVSKTIIRESKGQGAVLANNNTTTIPDTKTNKKGVIKTYRETALKNKKTKVKDKIAKKIPTKKTPAKKVAKTAAVATPAPKTYAMYKNRTPQTSRNTSKDKNYRKINREIRRRKRAQQAINETAGTKKVTPSAPKKSKADNSLSKKLEAKKLKQEALLKKENKELKKKERNLKRQAQLEKEKKDELAIERARLAKKEARAEKRKLKQLAIDQKAQADLPKTKKIPTLKKKKFYENGNPKISETVINAEPIGNPKSQKDGKTYIDETGPSTARCITTARSEKVADWTSKLHKKYDDEARTNYIRRKLGTKCISNNNLGVLMANYETQIGRYKLIRLLYPQLESPQDIMYFEKYFESKSYITKLKELKSLN